jgi:uncharacterized glyoxalase superfamily protein PhnB
MVDLEFHLFGHAADCDMDAATAMKSGDWRRRTQDREKRVNFCPRMSTDFPGAVPEIPVGDIERALEYYEKRLGFGIDWDDSSGGGIAGISRGNCRMFLTNPAFREHRGNYGPVVIWLNLDSKEAVDALYDVWRGNEVKIVSPAGSKPWGLHEFTAADADGNLLRVFYDFATPEREQREAER